MWTSAPPLLMGGAVFVQVVAPALQLVLAVASQLPESGPVRGQAVSFVERHAAGLARILDDAADGRRSDSQLKT
jgi:hypothetical protein